jgi:hypothetical protein
MSTSLQDLMKDNNLPESVWKKLSSEPFNITTIKQFANFFDSKTEVSSLFCIVAGITQGSVVADVKQAWREAEAQVQKGLTKTSAGLPEEIIDSPLRSEVQATLQAQWTAWYMWDLPSSWRGPDSLLGRFHREFLKKTHVLYLIKKIRSLEMATTLGPSQTRHHLGGSLDIFVQAPDTAAEVSINSTWGYLTGLKIILYTMALAGAFKVNNVVFAPLAAMVKHLAAAENYAFTYNTGAHPMPDNIILGQLGRIDEGIRGEWAKRLRTAEGVTLGQVAEATEAYAASLWMINPSRDIPVQRGRSQSKGRGRGRHPRGRSQSRDRRERSRTPPRGGKGGKSKGEDGRGTRFGQTVKTARSSKSGKILCKPYNDARGCKARNCSLAHRCDVLLPSGNACEGAHSRADHRGPTVPL